MNQSEKKYKIKSNEIVTLIQSKHGCIASDMITVEGMKVKYAYREDPIAEYDSGWRFFSGEEDQNYVDIAENFCFYKVNTIANYDPLILDIIGLQIGTTVEYDESTKKFKVIVD